MEEFLFESYGIVILFLSSILLLLILLKFIIKSKRKSNIAMAQILNIETIFLKNNKNYEPYLNITYQYKVKKKVYQGSSKILFSFFVEGHNTINLYYNFDLDMPVLQIDQEFFIGNEAIEHKLINTIPVLPIRYLISDPSRNFILPLNKNYGFLSKKIKKIT